MDFTTLLEALLALLAVIVTSYVIPYIKTATTAEQQETISTWIDVAVAAAEQLFSTDQGQEKLQFVADYLVDLGLDVTTEEIESAVYWLHSSVTESEVE